MSCSSTSCPAPVAGIAAQSFATAVQFFAASQCLLSEGRLPEANVKNFDKFDFIIVGAGTAGCVIANRLSQVKEWNVLLLEAGDDPPIESSIPHFHNKLAQTKYNWHYQTSDNGKIDQGYINGSIFWPRGKVIGGTSNINGMMYVQGNDQDFQRWYDAGNEEWSVHDVRRCYKKAENFQDMNLLKDPEIYQHYGHNGPLVINTFNSTYRDLTTKVLTAWNNIGIKTVPDLNVANVMGSGIIRATAANGIRQSVSRAYLNPIKCRKNLKILKNALVTKILINPMKQAYGVIIKRHNKTSRIYATKEVILSAGSINSPQLLMLSGIGPKKHLRSKIIPLVSESPMVGQNLKDHLLIPVTVYADEPGELNNADYQFEVLKYFYNRTGSLAQPILSDIVAFFSLNKYASHPDLQCFLQMTWKNTPTLRNTLIKESRFKNVVADSIAELNKHYTLYNFMISLLHPHSKGRIVLSSSNPEEAPLIYPEYFSDPRDLDSTVDGIQTILKVLHTKYFKSMNAFLGRMEWKPCDSFKLGSRDYWKCICINMVGTAYHPVGTCKMGPNPKTSVVDSRLRVHGVKKLRVIDASVMPSTTSGNTNALTVMIGERGSELIKEDYGRALAIHDCVGKNMK